MTVLPKILIVFYLIISSSLFMNGQNINNVYVEKIINKAKKKFDLPAIAISVMSSDSVYASTVLGNRIYGESDQVTEKDYFHIGSCSKSILAMIAGRLVDENKIEWKTKYFDVYPEMKNNSNRAYHNITLEDLFLCKAGIQAYVSGDEKFPEIDNKTKNSQIEFAKYLLSQEPTSPINKNQSFKHVYSNASYTLASLMLEKVTSKSYEELINFYLFNKLGLTTIFGFPNKFQDKQPWGHLKSGKHIEKFSPSHEYEIPYLIKPAGDLSMPPPIFSKYVQLHLKGLRGTENFLSTTTWQYIHYGFKEFSLGIGNGISFGRQFSGMDGSTGTFFCRAILVPDSDFAFIIMTNAGSGTGEMKAIEWITKKLIKKHYNWWWKFWM